MVGWDNLDTELSKDLIAVNILRTQYKDNIQSLITTEISP